MDKIKKRVIQSEIDEAKRCLQDSHNVVEDYSLISAQQSIAHSLIVISQMMFEVMEEDE